MSLEAADGTLGFWPEPSDVVASDPEMITAKVLTSPPMGWPQCFKGNPKLKALLGKKFLAGKRCRLIGRPSEEDMEAISDVTLSNEDSFANALAVERCTGWEVVRGFAVYELSDSVGSAFVGHKRWWNQKETGIWMDPTPRIEGADELVLLESALSTKVQVAMSDSVRAAAQERLALGGFPLSTPTATGEADAAAAEELIAYDPQPAFRFPRSSVAAGKKTENSPTEPAPEFAKKMMFGEVSMSFSFGSHLQGSLMSGFSAKVKAPSGTIKSAQLEGDGEGKIAIKYTPTEAGMHLLELFHAGMTIGKPHPFKSSNGVLMPPMWATLTQNEKLSVLRWIARRLDAHDFDGVVVVDATSSTLLIASTDTNSTRPPESDEAQLILIGVVAEGKGEQFEALRTEIIAAISDAKFYVVESQGVIQDGLDICERLQCNYTRSHNLRAHFQPSITLDGRPRTTVTIPSSGSLAEAATDARRAVAAKVGHRTGAMAHLEIAAIAERWMHARCQKLPQLVSGVQLEGFGPASIRGALVDGMANTTAIEGSALTLDGVLWYTSKAQGELHMRRRAVQAVDEPPVVQIEREAIITTQYQVGRMQQVRWLASVEAFFKSSVPKALSALLSDPTQPDKKMAHRARTHDWRRGQEQLAQRPRIDFYPSFLSDAEVDHLLHLGLLHAKPSDSNSDDNELTHGGGAIVQFQPSLATDDAIVQAVEERIAEATGVPVHDGESALVMRHNVPIKSNGPVVDSVHLDTNNDKRFRCATVIIYLNDVPEGCGGETRFPLADLPEESPLVAAAVEAATIGLTAIKSDVQNMPAHFAMLQEAACKDECPVKVRPQRGAAIAFWTQTDEGAIDGYTWHNGTRVLNGGGGKWIAQKFKEFPRDHPAYDAVAALGPAPIDDADPS